jgi:hypothetical protein
VLIEQHDTYRKQTYRNRCVIATAQGAQALTVPVVHHAGATIADVLISDHGNWRHQHWQAITSAYGDSPFLEYYEDDIRPFFTEHRWERLLDFNEDIRQKMCELLDIRPQVSLTTAYRHSGQLDADTADLREAILPKATPPRFTPQPYYQVFAARHGFMPGMSILDLLLNMGPEAIFYL